nr:MAG TPA: hypothetical protein [Caudoviricetes sp.]
MPLRVQVSVSNSYSVPLFSTINLDSPSTLLVFKVKSP